MMYPRPAFPAGVGVATVETCSPVAETKQSGSRDSAKIIKGGKKFLVEVERFSVDQLKG